MDRLVEILQRVAVTNELMTYGIILLGVLIFLGLVMMVMLHRQAMHVLEDLRRSAERQNYYLFNKLDPVELP